MNITFPYKSKSEFNFMSQLFANQTSFPLEVLHFTIKGRRQHVSMSELGAMSKLESYLHSILLSFYYKKNIHKRRKYGDQVKWATVILFR